MEKIVKETEHNTMKNFQESLRSNVLGKPHKTHQPYLEYKKWDGKVAREDTELKKLYRNFLDCKIDG